MANIPQFVSKENLTTSPGADYRQGEKIGITQSTAGVDRTMDMASRASQQLILLGEKMTEIDNANSESKAKIETTKAKLAFRDKINKSPDPAKDMEGYDDYMKATGENAGKLFRDQQARQKFAQDWELDTLVEKSQLQGIVYKKQVEERKVNILQELELKKSEYRNAPDEAARNAAVKGMEEIINNKANLSIYDPLERKELLDKTVKDAQDDLKDAESLRRVKEKEFKAAQDAAVNAREDEFIKMKINGKDRNGVPISREELIIIAKNDMESEAISSDFADKYINALKSPKAVTARTVDKDFADIISEINKGTKLEKVRKELLDMASDGYISETDFAGATAYMDMVGDKEPDDLVAKKIRFSWGGLEIATEDTTGKEESRSRMSRTFINKLQSGVDPQDASVEAMREEVLYLHPEARLNPNGIEYMDDKGVLKVIMPNGDVVVSPAKKTDTRKKDKTE
jgi:hypothetical protein